MAVSSNEKISFAGKRGIYRWKFLQETYPNRHDISYSAGIQPFATLYVGTQYSTLLYNVRREYEFQLQKKSNHRAEKISVQNFIT